MNFYQKMKYNYLYENFVNAQAKMALQTPHKFI